MRGCCLLDVIQSVFIIVESNFSWQFSFFCARQVLVVLPSVCFCLNNLWASAFSNGFTVFHPGSSSGEQILRCPIRHNRIFVGVKKTMLQLRTKFYNENGYFRIIRKILKVITTFLKSSVQKILKNAIENISENSTQKLKCTIACFHLGE